jgi:hypothetical protein
MLSLELTAGKAPEANEYFILRRGKPVFWLDTTKAYKSLSVSKNARRMA